MLRTLQTIVVAGCLSAMAGNAVQSGETVIRLSQPQTTPNWALLEREVLRANALACREYFKHYFDERGWLLCVERWGGDDGPDDAIENVNDWPILHALGAPDDILTMYRKVWEGHLRQYTIAKTKEVPFAKDGMYYKEFPVMFDWQHNGEGLSVFNLQGLSDVRNRSFQKRVRRYAGFYLNEDLGAPNFDPKHKIIRSLFNGSRGPLLRKATALDWTGDSIEVENRFELGHGERNYEEMLAHFETYNDIVGDHPLNLLATTLPLNAYMLTGDEKYKRWLLEYVDAWRTRMSSNGNIIPSNVGLDGTIGGECDGKWYGGTYGWSFSPVVPQTGEREDRNRTHWGFVGFMNAYLLTGDDQYLEAWRKQTDVINAQGKLIDGKMHYPTMHGDDGWYSFVDKKYDLNAAEIAYLSQREDDFRRSPQNAWTDYLRGIDGEFPVRALHAELVRIRNRVRAMHNDKTTPDTRLADDPMEMNPASVTALLQLMMGGIHVTRRGSVLHARLRYFDPEKQRAGIPDDVAALVETMDGFSVVLSLVNVNQVEPRTVVIQAGSYGEHQFVDVADGSLTTPVNAAEMTVRIEPGCGGRLHITMNRYVNQPTLFFPWDR